MAVKLILEFEPPVTTEDLHERFSDLAERTAPEEVA
mgnify:CR=1 FL=1